MNQTAVNILHITPHFGGGVGKVLFNYLDEVKNNPGYSHKVLCLDYANDEGRKIFKKIRIPFIDKIYTDKVRILSEIDKVDIVFIHWWNHPLLFHFLITATLPAVRLIIWSHIAGHHLPQIFTKALIEYPDYFVVTTPHSLETPIFKKKSGGKKDKIKVIPSCIATEHLHNIKKIPHKSFNVGYIGTVGYSKIHPDFIRMSIDVAQNLNDIRFIVCGGASEKHFIQEAKKLGFGEYFSFTGHITDITNYLSIFDVFGYPLAPWHYGTSEQALIEALSAGIPAVVFNNGIEKFIVQNGITGFVVNSSQEYIDAIRTLYNDPELREKMGNQAREFAKEKFSLSKMVVSWEKLLTELMQKPKRQRIWSTSLKTEIATPAEIFIESLDGEPVFQNSFNAYSENEILLTDNEILKLVKSKPALTSKTKGTPEHYLYFFRNDKYLEKWAGLIKEYTRKSHKYLNS